MSKISTLFGAAALLVSVSAFAQTTTTTTTTTPPVNNAPAAAPAPMATPAPMAAPAPVATPAPAPMASSQPAADKDHAKMHHKHRTQTARNNGTDNDADKLNACMAYATPTSSQEQCLRKASAS